VTGQTARCHICGVPVGDDRHDDHASGGQDMTDHSDVIARLRSLAPPDTSPMLADAEVRLLLAADLLELHDLTGISLDAWCAAREFVERTAGITVTENGA
jgi:hypothetical protein